MTVEALNPPTAAPVIEPDSSGDRIFPGTLNTLLMFVTFGAALLYVLWLGRGLPAEVASHFGVAGDVNGRMSRDGFVSTMMLTMVGIPLVIWASLGWGIKRQKVKIPHASYWLSAPHRDATVRFLYTHFTWLSILVTVFLGYVFWLVAAANAGAPAHPALDTSARPTSAWVRSWPSSRPG